MPNVTPKTMFGKPKEVITTLAHSAKGVLLGELRVCPVEAAGVMRLKLQDPDEADKFYLAGSLWNWLGHEGRSAPDEGATFRTDKHKVIWMCPVSALRQLERRREDDAVEGTGLAHPRNNQTLAKRRTAYGG